MNDEIAINLKKILGQIADGNDRGEKITLLGATKFVDAERIKTACENGLTAIGENHAQEFRDKFPFYPENVEKHFIGTLQSNKLKYVVGKADYIDSVSSVKLAEKINESAARLGIVQKIMIEINAADEPNKTGMKFSDAKAAYEKIKTLQNVKVCGITAMLPATDDEAALAESTEKIRDLYDEIKTENPDMKYLSIGMTNDYSVAIKHGSNMIRLGRAIFGERRY